MLLTAKSYIVSVSLPVQFFTLFPHTPVLNESLYHLPAAQASISSPHNLLRDDFLPNYFLEEKKKLGEMGNTDGAIKKNC